MRHEEQTLIRTGIDELDKTLNGGIPRSSSVLVAGGPGTGKTVLSLQWLFSGATEMEERGLYLAATENIGKVQRNARDLAFFDQDAIDDGMVEFSDLRTLLEISGGKEITDREAVDAFIEHLTDIIDQEDISRIVIDSISALGYLIPDTALYRYCLFRLSTLTTATKTQILFVSEAGTRPTEYGVEDFMADGIFFLQKEQGSQRINRMFTVEKMRGMTYQSGTIGFDITKEGITFYPKIPRFDKDLRELGDQRASTGNDELDEMLEGGIPVGHTALMTGNTGTGKSTLAMQFLMAGLEDGESAVLVDTEGTFEQMGRSTDSYGWDIERYMEEDRLRVLRPEQVDFHPDKVLQDIIDAVKETGADRIALDSISTLESPRFSPENIREFVHQLNSFTRMRGLTSMLTCLSTGTSGDARMLLAGGLTNELRLSSLVDTIIMLQYQEREDRLDRLLNIVKVRGSDHSRNIRKYSIGEGGMVFEKGEEER